MNNQHYYQQYISYLLIVIKYLQNVLLKEAKMYSISTLQLKIEVKS